MSAKQSAVQAPALPQVNLLPPEVKAARGLAATKRWLALGVLVAVLMSAGLVVKATFDQSSADDKLTNAQNDTARLNAQKAQYAEVPAVLNELQRAKDARELGMSTEVLWRSIVRAIAATTPPGVRIDTMRTVSATPMVLPAAPVDPLAAAGISTITFTAQSVTIPDTEAWLRALSTIPGFSDAWFSQEIISADGDAVFYNLNAVVLVTDQAYAERFSKEAMAAAEAAADAAAEETGDDASAEEGED